MTTFQMLFFLLQPKDCLTRPQPVAHRRLCQSRYQRRLQENLAVLLDYTGLLSLLKGELLCQWGWEMQGFQPKQHALLEPALTQEYEGPVVSFQDEL